MSSNLPHPAGAADAPTGAAERPSIEASSDGAAAPASPPEPASAPAPEPPPRAVWTLVEPTAPWCPDVWTHHLEAVAPGLAAAHAGAARGESIGEQLGVPGWTLVLASRRGRLHAHRGEHREDAGAMVGLTGGWCAAVADGAGSAPWSRLGAAIATRVFTHAMRDTVPAGDGSREALATAMQQAAHAANAAMRDFAGRAGLALRDLRTTLLAAVLHQGTVGVMQVGDGAMALMRAERAVTHPHAAATGDYSGEVAHFLPDDGALTQLQQSLSLHTADDTVGLVLATDGVDDPWYPFTRHVGALYSHLVHGVTEAAQLPAGLVPAWAGPVLDAADPVQALMDWLAFEKRGENDDRTLCVVQRTGTTW